MELTTAANLALLILRVVVGLTLAAHGWNKFTGGGQIPGPGRWFASIGLRPGRVPAQCWSLIGSILPARCRVIRR